MQGLLYFRPPSRAVPPAVLREKVKIRSKGKISNENNENPKRRKAMKKMLIGIGAVGGIAGPTLAGWAYDNWGSYQLIWLLLGGISFLPVISALTIRPVKS